MRLKSAYREKPVEQPPDISEPSEKIDVEVQADPEAIVAAIEPADEATLTLQKQIADLKKSEELQRNYARYAAQQQIAAPAPTLPADPEARIALWRTQGLDEGDAAFLSEHLEMAERPDLTRLASDEAAEHHQRGTDNHRRLTKEIFDQHLALREAAPAAPAKPAPAFFRPEPSTRSPAAPDRSEIVSAPVSRTVPGYREQNPRSVRLSPAEIEAAKASGVSETEYGRQKLIMMARKANGEIPH
jgi:hypothetical protein